MPQTTENNPPAKDAADGNFVKVSESMGFVHRLTDARDGRLLYLSPGFEKVWGRPANWLDGFNLWWLETVHPDDRQRVSESLPGSGQNPACEIEYRIVRPDGTVRWIHDRVAMIRDENGEPLRMAGLVEDITGRKLMEKEVVEDGDRELSRLGMDLHDGICQQLVGIAFATDLLRRDLLGKSPGEAFRAAKITALLDAAISQARNLSQVLSPVNLTGNGLEEALRSLAENVSRESGVSCVADFGSPIFMDDHILATHLYRIAQSAVQNSLRHAYPSQILIRLSQKGETLCLKISDNSLLMDETCEREYEAGLGIVRLRADLAGAVLRVERAVAGESSVTCAFQYDPAAARASGTGNQFLFSRTEPNAHLGK